MVIGEEEAEARGVRDESQAERHREKKNKGNTERY